MIKEIDPKEIIQFLPKRQPNTHKGTYGHILIVGGSIGFGGAPALTALGALRTGAGLVTAALPSAILNGPIAAIAPEAMAHPIPGNRGHLNSIKFLTWLHARKPFDAIAIGPGLGKSEETTGIVKSLLKIEGHKLVLDADALNIIATSENGLSQVGENATGERILTPHTGEAARLLQTQVDKIENNREEFAKELAHRTNSIVVLKGHGTIVALPNGETQICPIGGPGMATGGSGDVLTGIITALWGQKLPAKYAALLGVYLHALAGDIGTQELGEESLLARDIANNIGKAIRTLRTQI